MLFVAGFSLFLLFCVIFSEDISFDIVKKFCISFKTNGLRASAFLFISAIYGIKNILNRFPKVSNLIAVYLLIVISISALTIGPLFFSKSVDKSMRWVPQNKKQIDSYLKSIPQGASVAATNNLGAHLSHRITNYSLGKGYLNAEYILFLIAPNSIDDKNNKKWEVMMARKMLQNKNFIIDYQLNNFLVFKKIIK